MLVDGSELHVRVVIPKPDRKAAGQIYRAEAAYLQATAPHQFALQVVPASRAPIAMPEPYLSILER